MDAVLRHIENLPRHELVWLMSYIDGRLRVLPSGDTRPGGSLQSDTAEGSSGPSGEAQTGTSVQSVAPLSERICSLNQSMDPWEMTGAAPQGWAQHIQQSMLPIHGYIQLRPRSADSLPVFGAADSPYSGGPGEPPVRVQPTTRRVGKASPSVSIFSRAPLCKYTCRYCRCQPCDVGSEHDDHTCYACEQKQLHPNVPGAAWVCPFVPACPSWCSQCTTQRCALRGLHDSHLCMDCEHQLARRLTPAGGEDPWAATTE